MEMRFVFLPLFMQVALTFILGFWLAFLHVRDFREGKVKAADIALREPNWPPRTMQVANAFANQLELPVLFYVLTILAWITHHSDLIFVAMAWIFVVLRIVHAYIHTTSNVVARRGPVFILSAVVLALMWLIFAVRIMLGIG